MSTAILNQKAKILKVFYLPLCIRAKAELSDYILLLSVCFVLGMLITIAEPDLQVLANQVSAVMNGTVLIYAVGLGVGAFLVIAILKIAVFIIAVCLVLWVVWANTQPIPEEPCDLNECDTCSFPCEQHEKKKGSL